MKRARFQSAQDDPVSQAPQQQASHRREGTAADFDGSPLVDDGVFEMSQFGRNKRPEGRYQSYRSLMSGKQLNPP
eukprot:CAMPEP_0177719112 /NCGR_PEP_ID=MMETSP0484_2-20121128/15932_1 /TAXON_ID=354590 /ORGANISM="Rhodomonas lens, Strain RHODO" /LENGTH=74 /DNA_ID=CAMNT_0019231313 /DNA_START=247 /DNA_END=468 /DNA_ORIENTATION=-